MVTTDLKVEVKRITLSELGASIGIPIKVKRWWGSVRGEIGQFHRGCSGTGWVSSPNFTSFLPFCYGCHKHISREDVEVRRFHGRYVCPGGYTYCQIKRPEVQKGVVVIWEGPCHAGTSRRHNHRQSVEVLDVDGQAMLLRLTVSTSSSHFLIGMDDGHPFVTAVNRRPATVPEAFDWLMPNKVREAYALGLDVKRQGDWFFIPTTREPRLYKHGRSLPPVYGLKWNTLYRGVALIYGTQTRHTGGLVVYQSVPSLAYPAPLVRGNVKAPNHPALHLSGWHIGVRTRSTPGGSRGGPGLD